MTEKQNGLMIHFSRNPCLDKPPYKFYNSLIKFQKEIGCTYKNFKENDRQFDNYLGQTYIKGMTSLKDGQSIFILGKDHHEKVYELYFQGDFQNSIKWGLLGDSIENGILLIDFQSDDGSLERGVAINNKQVKKILCDLSKDGYQKMVIKRWNTS